MLRTLLKYLLILDLLFLFCSKNSTANNEDKNSDNSSDIINIEIKVLENGNPVENIFVEIDVLVQESTYNQQGADWETRAYTTTKTYDDITDKYGVVNYRFENKSVADKGGIVLSRVTISRGFQVVFEKEENRLIKKNNNLKLEYEIGEN